MRKSRPQYIAGKITGRNGEEATLIRKIPELRRIKALFCRHPITIKGESCSENGLRRISGEDIYECCLECGKILKEHHYDYV